MGESKCKYCDEAATVHVNLILNGESHKIHLCQACAEQKGVTGTEAFSLMDIEESFSGVTPAEKRKNGGAVVCRGCGFPFSTFKKSGRLGCPSCYQTFEKALSPIIKGMHKGSLHKGKVPHRGLDRRAIQDQIEYLDSKLRSAVAEERYEDAAHYRDQLNKLRSEPHPNPAS